MKKLKTKKAKLVVVPADDDRTPLSEVEQTRYAELKEQMLTKMVDALGILKEIHDGKLYRAEFGTWAKFCEWYGMSEMNVNRQLTGYSVNKFLMENNLTTVSANAAEVLDKCSTDKQLEVVKSLMERNEQVTREAVELAINGKPKEDKKVYGYVIVNGEVLKKETKDIKKKDGVIYGTKASAEAALEAQSKKPEPTSEPAQDGQGQDEEKDYHFDLVENDDGGEITWFIRDEDGHPVEDESFFDNEDEGWTRVKELEKEFLANQQEEKANVDTDYSKPGSTSEPDISTEKRRIAVLEQSGFIVNSDAPWWVGTPEGQLTDDEMEKLETIMERHFNECRDKFEPHQDLFSIHILGLLENEQDAMEMTRRNNSEADEPTLEDRTRAMLEPRYKENGAIAFTVDDMVETLRVNKLNITGRTEKTVRKILTAEGQTLEGALASFQKSNPKPKFVGTWD